MLGADRNLRLSRTHILSGEGYSVTCVSSPERAELLGGGLNINSRSGKGTFIDFAFPVVAQVAINNKVQEVPK